MPENKTTNSSFEKLVAVMARLRNPDNGCAWDVKQNHRTLIPYLIEEAYEVIEAIDQNDPDCLCEELGDLLLQIVFHAEIAQSEKRFSIDDVVKGITSKLIRRHPHVFEEQPAGNAEEALARWNEIKAEEKKKKAKSESGQSKILDGIPKSLPALARATQISDRARGVGFDWPTLDDLKAKLVEEIDELIEAAAANDMNHTESEFGDVLFVLVNVGRKLGLNPEMALQNTNNKFTRRFTEMEKRSESKYKGIQNASIGQLEVMWQEIKKEE